MTRRHYMLGFAGFRVEYQNVVKLWVRVRNGVTVGVGIGVRVRVRVWVRFRAKVRVFSNAKLRMFSQGKMTSCHFGSGKQVTTASKQHGDIYCANVVKRENMTVLPVILNMNSRGWKRRVG